MSTEYIFSDSESGRAIFVAVGFFCDEIVREFTVFSYHYEWERKFLSKHSAKDESSSIHSSYRIDIVFLDKYFETLEDFTASLYIKEERRHITKEDSWSWKVRIVREKV
jgi:hypothetical protein